MPSELKPFKKFQKRINELTAKLKKANSYPVAVAVSSKIFLYNGIDMHLPMIDFSCPISPENLNRIKDFLKTMQLPGAILETGRSYHFYGSGAELLTEEEWRTFMGFCSLATSSGLISPRYIGHQLIYGACHLRVSTNSRKPKMPEVVATIG